MSGFMAVSLAKNKLALPNEWIKARIPKLDARLYDGSRVYVPAHDVEVALRYPTYENGMRISNVTQAQMAQFLKDYNASNNTDFSTFALFEDEAVREQLGKDHALFDENFKRNGQPWKWGYVADFTRPYGNGEEGINGQQLVRRIAYWRLPGEDVELGVVTIAPDGIVPTLSRKQLEEMIGKVGLKKLEKLRGKEIYEKRDEVVNVKNPLGYPQLTLGHEARDEGGLIPHNHHNYRPEQNYGETVGVRGADWDLDGQGCFSVDLGVRPAVSDPGGSFPLVREEKVIAKIKRSPKEISVR